MMSESSPKQKKKHCNSKKKKHFDQRSDVKKILECVVCMCVLQCEVDGLVNLRSPVTTVNAVNTKEYNMTKRTLTC